MELSVEERLSVTQYICWLGPPHPNTTDWGVSTAEIYVLTVLDGAWKSQYQDISRFSFFWGQSPWPTDGHFLAVYSHGCPSACVFFCLFCLSVYFLFFCVFITSSYKDTKLFELGPTHVALFYLNYHFKGPISKYITLWGTATYRFSGETYFSPKYQQGTCSMRGALYHQGYRKTGVALGNLGG